jgi:hypothetical protein
MVDNMATKITIDICHHIGYIIDRIIRRIADEVTG